MVVNSYSLKGVVMAVLVMFEGSTGMWWYMRTWSILEKTVVSCREEAKSWM